MLLVEMTIRLVDPVYLKVPKTKKIVVKKKINQSAVLNKNAMMVFFFIVAVSLMYFVYEYVQKTPIVHPDLECLPKNIRNTDFCKNIEEVAQRNRDKIYKKKKTISLKAYNDDELSIKFFNAP